MTNILIYDDNYETLQEIATQEDIDIYDVVNELIAEYLKGYGA